jgi:hypothetical protein
MAARASCSICFHLVGRALAPRAVRLPACSVTSTASSTSTAAAMRRTRPAGSTLRCRLLLMA